ncbi:MAG TPA: bifunctional molybdenum cofactor biosynthesis protein MoaC/MoaB [Candidatus Limnocylindria bacterium]|nr:bifunctional molybdenum cofactor biosynthesis protein MoaC/MoaB [Candidatus Limnocylindria bacterium]
MTRTPSHLGPDGEPRMVDVGAKPVTARRALARAVVRMDPANLAVLLAGGGPKGDALGVARLAGIAAAKRTPDLIPLCHPIPLDAVVLELVPEPATGTVEIRAEVRATARTGVEMEALTAASVAALTLIDMAKALQRDIAIERIELLEKDGGRSGSWRAGTRAVAPTSRARATHEAAVITCSTRAAAGERPDDSGPAVVDVLRKAGWDVAGAVVVADDEQRIAELLAELADAGHRLVVTTGGTGLTPGDLTPAATRRVIDREVPGLAELMRSAGLSSTPLAALSRGVVGARGATLIVNLPGSPRGAAESLAAVLPVLRHAVEQLAGGDH